MKENLRRILPEMFEDFFRRKEEVAGYPLRKMQLHEMRKAGKPLRYAMELGEYCFGEDFGLCLAEVKNALELMGDVHDCDVMIPELAGYLNEMRLFNKTIRDKEERFSTAGLRENIYRLRRSRKAQFDELCALLNGWAAGDFKSRLINSFAENSS